MQYTNLIKFKNLMHLSASTCLALYGLFENIPLLAIVGFLLWGGTVIELFVIISLEESHERKN